MTTWAELGRVLDEFYDPKAGARWLEQQNSALMTTPLTAIQLGNMHLVIAEAKHLAGVREERE